MEVIVLAVAASSPTLAWRALHLLPSLHRVVSTRSALATALFITGTVTSARSTHFSSTAGRLCSLAELIFWRPLGL